MYYIEENDKLNKLTEIFSIIKIEDNKILLPIGKKNFNEKRARKLARRTKDILEKVHCNKIVISKKIQEENLYVNLLNNYNIEIVDGKWLFQVIMLEILNYIIEKQKINKKECVVSVLVNYPNTYILENIKVIAKQYKRVNIVTNYIEKFKNIENELMENNGIMITLTNNKKKSLVKSKMIINIDFSEEILNKYEINEEAIILNVLEKSRINKKRYNGVNIIDYEINYNEEFFSDCNDKELYYQKEVYEANLYKKQEYEKIRNQVKKDGVEIVRLKTKNGIM